MWVVFPRSHLFLKFPLLWSEEEGDIYVTKQNYSVSFGLRTENSFKKKTLSLSLKIPFSNVGSHKPNNTENRKVSKLWCLQIWWIVDPKSFTIVSFLFFILCNLFLDSMFNNNRNLFMFFFFLSMYWYF